MFLPHQVFLCISKRQFSFIILNTLIANYIAISCFRLPCDLIALSTSLFHHHVTLCLGVPLVHPQLLSAVLSKSSLSDFHKSSTWFSTLTLCVTFFKSLAKFSLTSPSFNFQTLLFGIKDCFSTLQGFIHQVL